MRWVCRWMGVGSAVLAVTWKLRLDNKDNFGGYCSHLQMVFWVQRGQTGHPTWTLWHLKMLSVVLRGKRFLVEMWMGLLLLASMCTASKTLSKL